MTNNQFKTKNYHEPSFTLYFITYLLWAEVH